jgi:hypothetical protein
MSWRSPRRQYRGRRRSQRIAYAESGYDDGIELETETGPGHSGGPTFDTEDRLIGVLASFDLVLPRPKTAEASPP